MEDDAMLLDPGRAIENMGNGIMQNHQESSTASNSASSSSSSHGGTQRTTTKQHKFIQSYIIALIYFSSVLAIKMQQQHQKRLRTVEAAANGRREFSSDGTPESTSDLGESCSLSSHVVKMTIKEHDQLMTHDSVLKDPHHSDAVEAAAISDKINDVRSSNCSSTVSSPLSEEWGDGLTGETLATTGVASSMDCCSSRSGNQEQNGGNSNKSSGYCSGTDASAAFSTSASLQSSCSGCSAKRNGETAVQRSKEKPVTTLFIANKTSSFINQFMGRHIEENSGWEPWLMCKPRNPSSNGRGRTWSGEGQQSVAGTPALSVGSSRSLDMSNHRFLEPGRSLVGGLGTCFFRRCTTQSSTGSDLEGRDDDNNTLTLQSPGTPSEDHLLEDPLVSRSASPSPTPAEGGAASARFPKWPQLAVGGIIGATTLLALICRAKAM